MKNVEDSAYDNAKLFSQAYIEIKDKFHEQISFLRLRIIKNKAKYSMRDLVTKIWELGQGQPLFAHWPNR